MSHEQISHKYIYKKMIMSLRISSALRRNAMTNLFNYFKAIICGPCLDMTRFVEKPRRRLANRKFQYWKTAHIILSDSPERRKCTLLDFSATGARIKLKGAAETSLQPQDQLTLIVSVDGLEVDCQVVWSKRKCVGLHFQGTFRPVGAALSSA